MSAQEFSGYARCFLLIVNAILGLCLFLKVTKSDRDFTITLQSLSVQTMLILKAEPYYPKVLPSNMTPYPPVLGEPSKECCKKWKSPK